MRVAVVRELSTFEHQYVEDGQPRDELNIVYAADARSPVGEAEPGLEFAWTPIDRLPAIDIRPALAKALLLQDP